MVKRICIIFVLLFTTFSFGASDYDKNIVVKNQTRNDKVKTVFREMMDNYEEEDIGQFFFYVSEDRFEQDYMTFYDAIDEDMRIYDILNIDTWVNKITEDGVKRFLEVQWEKRYESSKAVLLNQKNLDRSDEYEIVQRGITEFLFDEINGKYKLIMISGNNFWGGSLPEWKEEVGDIAGQESKVIVGDNVNGEYADGGTAGLPDLVIVSSTLIYGQIVTIVKNQGQVDIPAGTDIYVVCGMDSSNDGGGLVVGATVSIATSDYYAGSCTVDPDDFIEEENSNNNTANVNFGP